MVLRTFSIPVEDIAPGVASVALYYPAATIPVAYEVAVVSLGSAAVLGFFCVLVAFSEAWQRILGAFPEPAARFIFGCGIASVVDPFFVLVENLANGRYGCAAKLEACRAAADSAAAAAVAAERAAAAAAAPDGIARAIAVPMGVSYTHCRCVDGDCFKLYSLFLRDEGSGIAGALLAALIYAVAIVLSLAALYAYALHVHFHGRVLDLYRRLHATDADWFVPHDLEVDAKELHWIAARAAQWVGPRGMRRRIVVCNFRREIAQVVPLRRKLTRLATGLKRAMSRGGKGSKAKSLRTLHKERSRAGTGLGGMYGGSASADGDGEITTHLAVYNERVDGARRLLRHFLRTPDGAIVEILGDAMLENHGALGDAEAKERWKAMQKVRRQLLFAAGTSQDPRKAVVAFTGSSIDANGNGSDDENGNDEPQAISERRRLLDAV